MSKKYVVGMNKPVYRPDGDEIPDSNLGVIIGESVAQSQSEKMVMKLWGWAQLLTCKKSLELDEQDFRDLQDFVLKLKLPLLTIAQAIQCFNDAKDDVDRKEKEAAAAKEAEKASE
jgi:hypothetical protein